MENLPKVTFGFINCNRLFYLKSCIESLLMCTQDYPNKELIIIDNASIELGTKEYLDSLESRGFTIVRNKTRDPNNEFARGLNTIIEASTGKYVCPLAGDMQFIVKGGWLHEYVSIYERMNEFVGCIVFDAQRMQRINRSTYSNIFGGKLNFVIDYMRSPFTPSCNSFFERDKILEHVGKWSTSKTAHEGGMSAEAEVDEKIKKLKESGDINWHQFMPLYPVSAAIYTDKRGTMGRIRGNKRYGDYWQAKKDNIYYEIIDFKDAIKVQNENLGKPQSIEQVIKTIGFDPPVDEFGNWQKVHINPDTASDSDWSLI